MSAGSAIVQFRLPQGTHPSLEAAAARLGCDAADLDAGYGVVEVDLEAGLYAARVPPEAVSRVEACLVPGDDPAEGLFADPRIEPMGPPEP